LVCRTCVGGSVPRERALALVLAQMRPDWRRLQIHESSPSSRGISAKLKRECAGYIGSHYYPAAQTAATVDGWSNQNLERQTFDSERFDIVISLDVMEHVFHPDRAYAEIYRTLKPGGVYIHTFPVHKTQVDAMNRRAELDMDGTVQHLQPAQFHGNPIDSNGSLVTLDYGYDIPMLIARWAPFSVRICRFSDRYRGILGEYTEVFVCEKTPPTLSLLTEGRE
jgi:SAM-dependent methyltransferase